MVSIGIHMVNINLEDKLLLSRVSIEHGRTESGKPKKGILD